MLFARATELFARLGICVGKAGQHISPASHDSQSASRQSRVTPEVESKTRRYSIRPRDRPWVEEGAARATACREARALYREPPLSS